MNSLVYLVWTGIKNTVKELKQKPGKLVLYIVVIAGILAGMAGSLIGAGHTEVRFPTFWVGGLIFALLLLFLIISVQKGLMSGDTIFEMSDVNLLFVSPIDSRAILTYGLIRLAKVSFLAGFFIPFQGATLKGFGVGYSGLMCIFVVYIMVTMIFSLLSLIIYSITNGNPKRKRVVKIVTFLMFVPLLAYFAYELLMMKDLMSALNQVVNSFIFDCTPLVGWASAGTVALIQGDILIGIVWLALTLLTGIGLFVFMMVSRSDYYEDVLVATETAFEKAKAVKEGDVQAAVTARANVKLRGTGLGGKGASVFLYKHLRESFRQNRFGFFSLFTVITAVSVIAFSFIIGDEIQLTLILQVMMWMQIFVIGMGRGLLEMYKHYLFIIPELSFLKIIWCNLELVFKNFIESILFIGIPGIILGENIFIVLLAVLTYVLFNLLLIGINFLSIRWTQSNISNGILIVIYIAAVILIMLPGVIPALAVGFAIGGTWGTLTGLAILSVWEITASLICFALSKGVLDNCDMPQVNAYGK